MYKLQYVKQYDVVNVKFIGRPGLIFLFFYLKSLGEKLQQISKIPIKLFPKSYDQIL